MKRCTLCGGKLNSEKRCTLCGLDNTKNDDMYKHMVNRNSCEDEPLTHVHEEPSLKRVQNRPQPIKPNVSIQKQGSSTYKKAAKSKKKATGCVTFIGLIPFIIAIIGFLGSIASEIFSEMSGAIPEPGFFVEEEVEYDYDPYAWVSDEMPEYGDTYSMYLEAGIYEVGHHIPMGIYQIDIVSDNSGIVEVYDEWNEIFLSEFLDPYGENTSMTDVMLFDGAYLVVYSGTEVTLVTDNAQPITVLGSLNESQEPINLTGQLVAAKDFEPGTYNIVYKPIEDEYSFVDIIVKMDEQDYGFHMSFDSEMGEEVFYNVPLPEGAIIEVDEEYFEGVESLYLVPSEMTSDTDLESFYDAY